jgi:clan AA aspartic protease
VTGEVDAAGRALIRIRVRSSAEALWTDVEAWIDTAFDGEFVMPRTIIEQLGLIQSAAVSATLADGTSAVLESYHCGVDWFGADCQVEVIANNGRFPLLGIGLLRDRRLNIDFPARSVSID